MNYNEVNNYIETGRTDKFFSKFRLEQLFMLPMLSTIYCTYMAFYYIGFALRYLLWKIKPTMEHEELDGDFKNIAYRCEFHQFLIILNMAYWFILPNGKDNLSVLNSLNYFIGYWFYYGFIHTMDVLNHI